MWDRDTSVRRALSPLLAWVPVVGAARQVSWLFLKYPPPRARGLLTQSDTTGRPWRRPRMGDRRCPRAARPERASGCRDCPPLCELGRLSDLCLRKAQCRGRGRSLRPPALLRGTLRDCGGPKRGWGDAVCLLHWKGTSPAPVAGFLGVDSPAFGARAVDHSGLGFPLTGNACQTGCRSRSDTLCSAQAGVWFRRRRHYTHI